MTNFYQLTFTLPQINKQLKIKYLCILLLFFTTSMLQGQQPFITTWKTDNPGTSSSTSITIPATTVTGLTYNYDVDWDNDGTYDETGITNAVTHDFGTAGTYTIRIRGTFPYMGFNGTGDKDKFLSVDQWGDIAWSSMNGMFRGCSNLTIPASDAPDLTNATNMGFMFNDAVNFNSDIGHWDVSTITDMNNMFRNAIAFNQDIGAWNVGNVTDMNGMFYGADAFNQDIGNWDMSSAISTSSMLRAASFNQDIGNWDMSSVLNINNMFQGATAFNQDLNNWNVSNAFNLQGIFRDATAFNGNISSWDVSSMTSLAFAFDGASAFNQDISGWNTSNITTMAFMFRNTTAFNQDISGWNVSSVTTMSFMFSNATAFNQDLSSWDVSHVKNMTSMFKDAIVFDQNLGNWTIDSIETMLLMLNLSGLSVANYDSTLIGWASQNIANIELGADGLNYCNGEAARNMLVTNGWIITDDMKDCSVSTNRVFSEVPLEIFPNPTTANLTIMDGVGQATIYNMLGQTIRQFAINNEQETINVEDLERGQYILYIKKEDGLLVSTRFNIL